MLKTLGCDFIEFTPNWSIVRRVMRDAFERKGDFCWHCHCGIYSYPLKLAVKFNVPLVIWGEPIAEITAYYDYERDEIEYEDEEKFNVFRNLGISAEDMYGMIHSPESPVDRRDLLPYTYPSAADLRRINCTSICLGSFIPWDYTKNTASSRRSWVEIGRAGRGARGAAWVGGENRVLHPGRARLHEVPQAGIQPRLTAHGVRHS